MQIHVSPEPCRVHQCVSNSKVGSFLHKLQREVSKQQSYDSSDEFFGVRLGEHELQIAQLGTFTAQTRRVVGYGLA